MTNLFQIWITDNGEPPNQYVSDQILKLKSMYSDCDYRLYTDNDIKIFLTEFFNPEVLQAYESIKPYAFKADLARYCLLYVYGGYYFDASICPKFRYEHDDSAFILEGESVVIENVEYRVLDNGIMYFKHTNDVFLKSAIDKAVTNILNHHYGRTPIDITGPMMLYDLNHTAVKKFKYSVVDHKKVVCIGNTVWFEYQHGFSAQTDIQPGWQKNPQIASFGELTGTNSYAKMWYERKVYGAFVHDQFVKSIAELYRQHLKREPDIEGLNHYLNSGFSLDDIQNLLLNSEEYRIITGK